MFDVKILPSGDSAVLIQLGSVISPQVNAAVHALDAGIKSANINGIVETVPAFASLLVLYDPVVIGYEEISGALRALCENRKENPLCTLSRCATAMNSARISRMSPLMRA